MKIIIPLLLLAMLLLSGCSFPEYKDISVGEGVVEPIEKPVEPVKCKTDEISYSNKCIKVREPIIINGVVIIKGRLIIEDSEEEAELPCCYPSDKAFANCDCVYGMKEDIEKELKE